MMQFATVFADEKIVVTLIRQFIPIVIFKQSKFIPLKHSHLGGLAKSKPIYD